MITINGKEYKNPLLVFAMKEEAGLAFTNFNPLFTGIGKVNATYHLMKRLQENGHPDIIINMGTAGSSVFKREEVVCINQFVQRDMDASPLGIELFKTPFSGDPVVLEYGIKMDNLPLGVCGSGDHFEMEHNSELYNVVDMEVYALALVAQREDIPFLCLKYISDGADDNAVSDWNEEVKKASLVLKNILK